MGGREGTRKDSRPHLEHMRNGSLPLLAHFTKYAQRLDQLTQPSGSTKIRERHTTDIQILHNVAHEKLNERLAAG